jgi:uncharacterized protein with GYD domain
MPSYLVQVAYTPETVAALVANPQDRTEAIGKVVKNLGGKPGKLYLSFGDYDVVGIYEMPDNVSAAAFAMAIGSGGACKSVKTTPLMTGDEAVAAMKKAAGSGYKPVAK